MSNSLQHTSDVLDMTDASFGSEVAGQFDHDLENNGLIVLGLIEKLLLRDEANRDAKILDDMLFPTIEPLV